MKQPTSNTQRTSKKKQMGYTSSKKRRNEMIQFIAGAIFGAVFGFILVALMTVAKEADKR